MHIDGCDIEMISVNHSVPAVGYRVGHRGRAFAYSGDTSSNETLLAALNWQAELNLLFIESAFSNSDIELAQKAYHYCPELLARDRRSLRYRPKVCITHLKPGEETHIMRECRTALPDWDLHQLRSGDVFEL